MFAEMIQVYFFCCFLTSSSPSLRTLNPLTDCTQKGLDNCRISNCSETSKVERRLAPVGPEWGPDMLEVGTDQDKFIPVLNVSWRIQATGGILALRGSQLNIRDETANESICLQYSYNLSQSLNPNYAQWTFSLSGVVVQPKHTYEVLVFNLPEPDIGDYRIIKKITIPGCQDKIIQQARECRENGSLWQPQIRTMSYPLCQQRTLSIIVVFDTSEYSQKYNVSLKSLGVSSSITVLKENSKLLNVTFELSSSQCEFVIKIQPFFKQCGNKCWSPEKTSNHCFYNSPRTMIVKTAVGLILSACCLAYFLWRTFLTAPVSMLHSAVNNTPQCTQSEKRKRVLIIYSLDHPLYKNIVLKLCAFLMAKCGTEVVMDMLDSTRLGVMGGIQWLEWQKKQIENSSDKILILCSRGVQAKWRSMCNGKQVQLKEDAYSTVGDMLVPALYLMVPHFIQSASFEKYIIAYFDSICSEDDVPSPFNITVRYKLMKQFEELFFRILDSEKNEVGKVNRIEGLSEDDYHQCPTGRALRNAIEAFHAHQLEHPHWFEEELLENTDIDSDFVPKFVCQDKSRLAENNLIVEETTVHIIEQPVQLSLNM